MSSRVSTFCDPAHLINEAAVEALFVNRLLKELGYDDNQIRFKTSIDVTKIKVGSRTLNYKPDYILSFSGKPRIVIDAKSPKEKLDDYILQAGGYCLMLNQKFTSENPVQFFVLTNGFTTKLYHWDSRAPVLELSLQDFADGNPKFQQLKSLVSTERFKKSAKLVDLGPTHHFVKQSIDDINSAFAWCHQHIYRKGHISQAAGFEEFVKVVFLKLLSDRRIREKYPELVNNSEFDVPAAEVRFSSRWIREREVDTPNPLNTIEFSKLIEDIEDEIIAGNRKRIFKRNDEIRLNPEIVKGVVSRLESVYLFGIDADLNGRLFETFLNATMRGKDLGQFFTPRSIVKLGVKLASIKVSKAHTDIVLDACCGTGGFLIDALAEMWRKVETLGSLTKSERDGLKHQIATQKIFGVDVGREPNMARLTRMNMYLHGDGGSSIFEADVLDKETLDQPDDTGEVKQEKKQFRSLFGEGGVADVVLTNPPFAKALERTGKNETRILDQYAIGLDTGGGAAKHRKSVRSSLLFFERYHDLLKVGGRLITVIDDGILSGNEYSWFRDYLRVRLETHGWAFRRRRLPPIATRMMASETSMRAS